MLVVLKFRKIYPSPTENWRAIVRYLLDKQTETKFRLPLKLSLLRGSRPKSARASPQQCAHSAPDLIQIGSLLRSYSSYSRTLEHRFFGPVEYCHNSQ